MPASGAPAKKRKEKKRKKKNPRDEPVPRARVWKCRCVEAAMMPPDFLHTSPAAAAVAVCAEQHHLAHLHANQLRKPHTHTHTQPAQHLKLRLKFDSRPFLQGRVKAQRSEVTGHPGTSAGGTGQRGSAAAWRPARSLSSEPRIMGSQCGGLGGGWDHLFSVSFPRRNNLVTKHERASVTSRCLLSEQLTVAIQLGQYLRGW